MCMAINRPPGSARKRLVAAATVMALFVLSVGCSQKETAEVRGRVTVDGKPVGPGMVIFIPESSGEGRNSATGQFGVDGQYELTTFIGRHRVVVQGTSGASYGEELPDFGKESVIPMNYADPKLSGLTANVDAGENNIDLPLAR